LECDRLRRQRYYEQNRDKVLKSQRKSDLKRLYGLSLEDHQALLDRQGGACALCLDTFTSAPHVDHCHKTGKVRGLLCSNCNTALGLMQDSPELMLRAAAYVSRA
jgi:5-methylcytosine-specific restriction endonuclease McrA